MPGPPPPPPPTAPPPPLMSITKNSGGPDDRSALLKSIRTGTKLKKTVTNDKSAPVIGGKINNSNGMSSSGCNTGNIASTNGLNLGGLFAGGMPKLRTTGKLSISNNTNEFNNVKKADTLPVQQSKNLINVQNELKKQMASDSKNRGPPPPAPIRNISVEEANNGAKEQLKKMPSNGIQPNKSSLHSNLQQSNNVILHRKAKSNANLSILETTDSINHFNQQHSIPTTPTNHLKPVISHGKPNLAPKPPVLNGKPMTPPKKLIMNGKPINRAQSMRSPRSPSPQQQQIDNSINNIKFGTVRNLSSVIGQTLGQSTGNLSTPKMRPVLNGRPTAPPPSIPILQQPPPPPPHNLVGTPLPPSKTNIRPPNHAPPPPPIATIPSPGSLPQPPSHAPPPPPHRTQPVRAPPSIPSNNTAPPPPPRHSSMSTTPRKSIIDLDEKFKHMFHQSNTFPKPPSYRNTLKLYTTRQAGSKQQAPQPPQLPSKLWDTSANC